MSFFNATTLTKRRRDKIVSLKYEVGNVFESPNDILTHTTDFFTILYSSERTHAIRHPIEWGSKGRISQRYMTATLGMPLRDSEITKALKSFKPLKAPGHSGLQPLFYIKYWDTIGEQTTLLCKKVFESFIMPPEANNTLLCLIPKDTKTQCLRNF